MQSITSPTASPHPTSPDVPENLSGLYSLQAKAVWRQVRREPICFWLSCGYLFFEYVRPQTIYPAIAFVPWTALFAVGAFITSFAPRGSKSHPNVISKLLILYGAVVLLSSTFAYVPSVAFSYLSEYFNWVIIYFAIVRSITTRARFFIFLTLYMLCNFKMTQHGFLSWVSRGFTFDIDGVGGAPGWFENSGEFGIQLCIFTPVVFAFLIAIKSYCGRITMVALSVMPFTALASVIATSSRGAMVGICAAAIWSVKATKYFVRTALIGIVIATAVYYAIPPESMHRFQNSGTDHTSLHRIDRWKKGWETMKKYPFLGVGHENWVPYYLDNLNYGVPGTPLVHNMFVQAGTENGFLGLSTIFAIILSMFSMNKRSRRLAKHAGDNFTVTISHGLDAATIGMVISSCFVTVLYYPYIWVHAAFVASLYNSTKNSAAPS